MAAGQFTGQIEGRLLSSGQGVVVGWENGYINNIAALTSDELTALPWLAPGLVDLQVNGFAGVDFNDCNLTAASLEESAHQLWSQGTTTLLPTIVSNSPAAIEQLLNNLRVANRGRVAASIPGYHLEGPFISPVDGPRGAHNSNHIQAPTMTHWSDWQSAAGRPILLVTMAPEGQNATRVIRELVGSGVIVAIGHSAATPAQIDDAVLAGASLSTHLGNGCHQLLPRHPNYLWSQLANDALWASIIADGFHLPAEVIKVFLRVKGERIIIISDATAFAGMPAGVYQSPIGGRVILETTGRLAMEDNPQLLAGSAQAQFFSLKLLAGKGIMPLSSCWALASSRPAQFLRLQDRGEIAVGKRADLVVLDNDQQQILATYLAGERVFARL